MKLVGIHGKGWRVCVLRMIFKRMASLNVSSLTPHHPEGLCCDELHLLKTLCSLPLRQLWIPEWSRTKMMPLHRPLLLHASTQLQVLLRRQTPPTTLLLHLLFMGTSSCSMSSNLFGPHWQKGEKHMSLIVFKRVHMGGYFMFCLVFKTLVLIHLVLWFVTLKLDGRLLLICYSVMRW